MEEEEGPVSLFIAVYSFTHQQVKIIQLDTPEKQLGGRRMDDATVVRFIPPDRDWIIRWYVPPTTSSTDDLYILPSCHSQPPYHSYRFNFINGSFEKIKPPLGHKEDGIVVYLGRLTYFMSSLNCVENENHFECYDPDQNLWKALKPFPDDKPGSRIVAYAVCGGGDTILFNVSSGAIWAYNVTLDDWYHVLVDGEACYSIVGNAVDVEGTIYALAKRRDFPIDTLLALSVSRIEMNGDLVYKCSLHSEICVPGIHPLFDDHEMVWNPTRDLLYLGKLNFCLVQTCMLRTSLANLYIQLTYMELTREKKLVIVMQRYHMMGIQDRENFEVVQCFFLPECKATAFKGGKRFDFEIDPHVVHKVAVIRLPPGTTVEQVEKGLDVFGPIVRDGISVREKEKIVIAFVEFESAASKQRAMKAKTFCIGDREALIYNRRQGWEPPIPEYKQPQSSGLQKDGQTQ